MSARLRFLGLALALALATPACAPLGRYLATLDTKPQLEAWGPGTVFSSVEAAAVDGLVYAYLQAREAKDLKRMRGGTIYPVEDGYTYGEVHLASVLLAYQVSYPLKPQDVAHFQMYPIDTNLDVNNANERPGETAIRFVELTDPLHRPLFILHPSLMVREYRGRDEEVVAVADLRHPERVILLAGGSRVQR